LLEMLATLLDRLGITGWTLELNSVGCSDCRPVFNEALRKALEPVVAGMWHGLPAPRRNQPSASLRLQSAGRSARIDKLPRMSQFLDEKCRVNFAAVREILDAIEIPYTLNDRPRPRPRLLHADGI